MQTNTDTQHTVRDLMPALEARVRVRMESMTVDCIVTDVKRAWGRVRLLVEPVSGSGQQWIELERLAVAPIEE